MESYYFQYMDSYHIIFHIIPFRQFPQLFFNSDIYTLKACANICDEMLQLALVISAWLAIIGINFYFPTVVCT